MTYTDPLFKRYTDFVLAWEGITSSDPDDTAASCAPTPGAVHTVRGVTYCTFRDLAPQLGISPATYERFLKLSDGDVSKFIYEYYKAIRGEELPDLLSIGVTEAAWGSGPQRAVKHLQAALNVLGREVTVDGDFGPKTLAAVKATRKDDLLREFWAQRYAYIDNLSRQPKYAKFRRGWMNRIADFAKRFPASPGSAFTMITLVALALFIIRR
jgi:lysozyme family protein